MTADHCNENFSSDFFNPLIRSFCNLAKVNICFEDHDLVLRVSTP